MFNKRILLSSLLLVSSLFASTNIDTVKKNVLVVFENQLKVAPGSSVKINYLEKDEKLGNWVGVNTLTLNGRKQVGMFLAFNQGKVIMPFTQNTILIQKNGLYMDPTLISMSAKSVQLKKQLKKEQDKIIKKKLLENISKDDKPIVLSKGKDKTLLVFTDPNCPYCVQKLQNEKAWKEIIKKNNVVVVLMPLITFDKNGKFLQNKSLHPYSPYYAATILTNLKNKKTFEEKFKVLKEYSKIIDRNNKKWKKLKYDKKDLDIVMNNSKKYLLKVGITGTPSFIVLDKNETKELFKKIR